MAKRKIIFSQSASIKLFQILDFYTTRNGNKKYSSRLYRKIKKELSILIKYPDLGIMTDFEPISGLIVDDFILFYEITDDLIIVLSVWDCRQNNENLKFK